MLLQPDATAMFLAYGIANAIWIAPTMFLAYGIANAIWIAPTMAGLASGIYLTKSKWKR